MYIFISVDPLAEQFMGWTPYHYVHQNPINLIDPTGMSAEGPGDPPDEEATELPEIVITFTREQVTPKNTTDVSKFNPSNSIPCVECHHKTSVPNGSISKPNGAVFWGDNATSFKAPNYGVGRDIESINIQFMIDLADVFSPEVSDRLEKASELFKYIDFSPKSNASNSTKGNIDNSSTSSNDKKIVEVDRKIYWHDHMWKKSPVRGHNVHKVRVYENQVDSVKNENRKDSIRVIKLR